MIRALFEGRWRVCGSRRRFIASWWDSAPWIRPRETTYQWDRCIMGGPVDPVVTCRRRTSSRSKLWCDHHIRTAEIPESGW